MGGGDDDKVKISKPPGRHGDLIFPVLLAFAAEKEPDALGLGQGFDLGNVVKIQLGIPGGQGAGNGFVPVVIGDADACQSVVLGVLQDGVPGLVGVTAAGGQIGMDVIVVIDPVFHKNLLLGRSISVCRSVGTS